MNRSDYQIYDAVNVLANTIADRVSERVQRFIEQHLQDLCTRRDVSEILGQWQHQQGGGERPALLQAKEVSKLVGLSKTMLWRLEKDGNFPQRVQLGEKRVAWPRAEVEAWIGARPRIAAGQLPSGGATAAPPVTKRRG